MVPTNRETSSIPKPFTYENLHRANNTPGAALADMLGVVPTAMKDADQLSKQAEPGPNEQAQLMALAQMGASRDRLKIAKGNGSVMGLLRGEETTLDAFNLERGRREADLFAGTLRDAYANSGLAHNANPAAFQAFVQEQQAALFGGNLKDADPAYYHGFLTRTGPVFEDMAKAHAGNLDGFIQSENKQAFQARVSTKMDIELQARAENDNFSILMDTLMGHESGGNYNAFHNNGNNQALRFTDMSIAEVLDWQKTGQWKTLGAGSSAVGKYQFIHDTLAEVVRKSGIDPSLPFSPAIQDQLIMFRLLDTRGMQRFLDGEISAEEFLDQGLALEFAGLKMTSGRGYYDGDGLNKGGTSAVRSIAALNAYREAFVKDPRSFKDDKGRIDVASLGNPSDPSGLGAMIPGAEAEYGISQVEARDAAADAIIERIRSEPGFVDRVDLPDIMRSFSLNAEQGMRVKDARDQQRRHDAAMREAETVQKEQAFTDNTIQFILTGDRALLETIGAENPMLANELLRTGTNTQHPETARAFLEGLDFNAPDVLDELIRGVLFGEIDREQFALVYPTIQAHRQNAPLLNDPVVAEAVRSYTEQLPEKHRGTFDRVVNDAVAALIRQHDGQRPPLAAIVTAAGEAYQAQRSMIYADMDRRAAKPEYQPDMLDKNRPWMRVAEGSWMPSPELLARIRSNPVAFPTAVEDIAAISGWPEWKVEAALWNPSRHAANFPTDTLGSALWAIGETAMGVGQGIGNAGANALDKIGIGGDGLRDATNFNPGFPSDRAMHESIGEIVGEVAPSIGAAAAAYPLAIGAGPVVSGRRRYRD